MKLKKNHKIINENPPAENYFSHIQLDSYNQNENCYLQQLF